MRSALQPPRNAISLSFFSLSEHFAKKDGIEWGVASAGAMRSKNENRPSRNENSPTNGGNHLRNEAQSEEVNAVEPNVI